MARTTSLTITLTAIICLVMMLTAAASAQECGEYEVTAIVTMDECPPFGIPPVVPFGINEQGWMVGFFQPCVIGPDTAFLWTPDDGLVVIPMPAGTSYSRAVAISGSLIVGEYDNSELELGRTGFLYNYESNEFTSLGTLPGGNWSEAHDINSAGQIAGFWGNNIMGPWQAFLWENGKMIDLGPSIGGANNQAFGINESGAITGWMGKAPTVDSHAFIWDDGKVTELPLLPGGISSQGNAINNQGDVAGRGWFFDPELNAFVWRAFAFINGKAINLGTLPGFEKSIATKINDDQIIVGFSQTTSAQAFIWKDGDMGWLNDVIPPKLGLDFSTARGINQTGLIAAKAHSDPLDATVGVILTPIVGPPGDLNGDCQVGVSDLLHLLSAWGTCNNCASCPADLDGNCVVSTSDLLILFSNWG